MLVEMQTVKTVLITLQMEMRTVLGIGLMAIHVTFLQEFVYILSMFWDFEQGQIQVYSDNQERKAEQKDFKNVQFG
jgi:hypothetical protein